MPTLEHAFYRAAPTGNLQSIENARDWSRRNRPDVRPAEHRRTCASAQRPLQRTINRPRRRNAFRKGFRKQARPAGSRNHAVTRGFTSHDIARNHSDDDVRSVKREQVFWLWNDGGRHGLIVPRTLRPLSYGVRTILQPGAAGATPLIVDAGAIVAYGRTMSATLTTAFRIARTSVSLRPMATTCRSREDDDGPMTIFKIASRLLEHHRRIDGTTVGLLRD